ncbi:AMIN-like domain-containing (lipo)protein [Pseudarthrobacter sp. H2]|uniref:AMIN-like domain-containing (lipo)protein n=1 Tax=Pseudarthrobacter sp. H2 TaxID=3418415 RepID=UPI003CF56A1E
MSEITSRKTSRNASRTIGTRTTGLGLLTALLLTGCTPSTPQPGSSSHTTAPASASATSTAAPAPSASATVPADSDETAPPQSGDTVISSTITHDWSWPGPGSPYKIAHQVTPPIAPPPEPPLPYLYTLGAGQHPSDNPPYDQMSFRFKGAFPSYEIEYVPELIQDGSGKTIPMPGTASILRVVFHSAQAHSADGTSSTIVSAPPESVGYKAITSYAQAGDFEGYVSYGIGVGRPMGTVPQTKVRVYEVEKIEQGQHLYVVAVQLDSTAWK